tara:strand:- start:38 stop:553 length:516 start_codon:yes stop_codon:yes gene_type:complete
MEQTCKYPNLSPSTAYKKKCRCIRCSTHRSKIGRHQYEKNKERDLKKAKERYSKKKEKVGGSVFLSAKAKLANALFRAKKLNCYITEDPLEKEKIKELYENCVRIQMNTGIQHVVDHIIPFSKGGTHTFSNLQILTFEKNTIKKYIDLGHWLTLADYEIYYGHDNQNTQNQ